MSKRKRIKKILLALLILFISAISIYFFAFDSLPFSPEMAFRRKEKQAMIGPAEIIAKLDFNQYNHILIGESDYGYTFFEWQGNANWRNSDLSYIQKQDGVTLYCTYYMYASEEYSKSWLPIFAFVDHPSAVSAELTLTITQGGETVSYPLSAQRSPEGYFLFSWDTMDLRSYDFWLVQQHITGAYSNYVLEGTVTATIRLYDQNGDLIETREFTK